MNNRIGESIRKARKEQGWTQAQLADAIGVKRSVVSKYENGLIEPSISKLSEIDSALGTKFVTQESSWAKECVLLLNSSLTVIKDMPNSHKDIGWSNLTDYIIKVLNQKEEPVVFILWGNFAKSKKQFITNKKHLILESTHPSPFSASSGFFGSHPFSKTNAFLDAHGLEPINWQL